MSLAFDKTDTARQTELNSGQGRPGDVSTEVALLCATLPNGSRVLDFSSGSRPHSLALIEHGYQIISIDESSGLLDLDLRLPGGQIDAAFCLEPPSWRDDADVTRVLRAVRAGLRDGGLLILANDERPTMTNLRVLVRASGFDVGQAPLPAWILATAVPTVPSALAMMVHSQPEAELNLRWSPDEVNFLSPTLSEIWAHLLAGDIGKIAQEYALTDPWGGNRASSIISSFFGVSVSPQNIVFGAGATSLLRQLAPLARAGRLLTTPLIHRDFPLWAAAEGAQLEWIANERDIDGLCAAVSDVIPQVLYIDRPSAMGDIIGLDDLMRICALARRYQAFVLVDEAYLSYFAGSASAISLAPSADNLVVIRSLSKAYCAGGLRVGFAVGGKVAAAALRRLAAPLQVSEVAFRMGLRLLEAGDIFVGLRARIAEMKSEMIHVLTRMGFPVIPGHAELPWLLIDDPSGQVNAAFVTRGIVGKQLLPFIPRPGCGYLRLAVPLSAERFQQFQCAMSTGL